MMRKKLFTVLVFTKLSVKRFFRDRLALFFGILFPLIFLLVFGGIFGQSANTVTFKIGLVNHSSTMVAKEFVKNIKTSKAFKINSSIHSVSGGQTQMIRGQLDAIVVLPPSFGNVSKNSRYPSGQAQVYYTNNTSQAGQTLVSLLKSQFSSINLQFVKEPVPFSVVGRQLNKRSLTQFDYTFSGLLGFSIVGLGIFGPVNVFPELKKQGILRRLHTTPIRVWQYFLSTMASQAIIGLISLAIMFIAAISLFKLKVIGNYGEIVIFLVFSIVMILGIGLAIGGWAKNERQAAPLANIIVFPMLFLSGSFFPRFLMPTWLQNVTVYLPLTPVIDGVRLMATEGETIFQLGSQLAIMSIWTIVIYAIAFRLFRWE